MHQSLWECRRIYGHAGVEEVIDAKPDAVSAVEPDYRGTGFEDSEDFGKKAVLELRAGHMMEHRERERPAEGLVIEGHVRTVLEHYGHVGAAYSLLEPARQPRIYLERRQVGCALAQQHGREARARANLEGIGAQLHIPQHPRQDLSLQPL